MPHEYVRYQNRKLYCLEESRYVTELEILDTLRADRRGVRISEHRTKKDVTGWILLSALSQSERIVPDPELTTLLTNYVQNTL